MKLGLNVAYWGLGLSAAEQLELVREAERLGYDSVWAAEAYGSDAATVLAWLAGQTETINLGSAIFQIPGRSPAMTARSAATLDQISGGRFRLGLGPSGPQVSEGWHGVRFGRQLQRTREYVEVVRQALARERVEYHGETIELPLPDGPGKALKLTIAPDQERIPVYIAAIGPKNVTLVGEIADGWLPVFFSREPMPPTYSASTGRMASRAASRSSEIRTFTMGEMSNPLSMERPDFAAPSSSSGRNSLTCSGEKNTGSQPSAISPTSVTFFGPIAAM